MTNPAPLAARYTDPSPRSLRPVEESDFAPSNAERVLLTGASGMLAASLRWPYCVPGTLCGCFNAQIRG